MTSEDLIAQDVEKNNIFKLVEWMNTEEKLMKTGTNFRMKTNNCYLPCENLSLLHIAAFYDNLEAFLLLEKIGISLRQLSGKYDFPLNCLSEIPIFYY